VAELHALSRREWIALAIEFLSRNLAGIGGYGA
jgi:hypothetical protein